MPAVLLLTVGAVNKPLDEMLPKVVVQVTPVSLVFWTVALNWNLLADATVALVGATVTITTGVGCTVTVAAACLVGSARLVAVTVTVVS